MLLRVARVTLYPQKLALISLTSGGDSVGIVCSRTQATEFSFSFSACSLVEVYRRFRGKQCFRHQNRWVNQESKKYSESWVKSHKIVLFVVTAAETPNQRYFTHVLSPLSTLSAARVRSHTHWRNQVTEIGVVYLQCPWGGVLEYLHCSPASRKTRWKGSETDTSSV
jgi:hypothetical protein